MGTCDVCGNDTRLRCACGGAYFCSAACQRCAWKEHKKVCTARAAQSSKKSAPAGNAGGARAPPAGGFTAQTKAPNGCTFYRPPECYEWLANCYQMRCDDDMCWGGCYLHGPYDPEATPLSIAEDFVVFCKLARRRGVVPAKWDWKSFVKEAAKYVRFAFEKSDAQERWGGENVFSTLMGKPSLRATGEAIYGSSCMHVGVQSDEEQAVRAEVAEAKALHCAGDAGRSALAGGGIRMDPKVLQEVGGVKVWDALVEEVTKRWSQ